MIAKRPDIRRIRASMELGAGLKLGRVTPRRATVSERSCAGCHQRPRQSREGSQHPTPRNGCRSSRRRSLKRTCGVAPPGRLGARSDAASGPRRHPDRSRQHLIRAAPISFHAVRRPVARGLHQSRANLDVVPSLWNRRPGQLVSPRRSMQCGRRGQQLMRLGICHIWRAAMRSLGNSTTPGAVLEKQRRWRKQPRKMVRCRCPSHCRRDRIDVARTGRGKSAAVFRTCARGGAPATGQILGVARGDEHGAAVAEQGKRQQAATFSLRSTAGSPRVSIRST